MSEQIIELSEAEVRFIGRVAYETEARYKLTRALRGKPYHELEDAEFNQLHTDVVQVAQGGHSFQGDIFDQVVKSCGLARGDLILTAAVRDLALSDEEIEAGLIANGTLASESKPKRGKSA